MVWRGAWTSPTSPAWIGLARVTSTVVPSTSPGTATVSVSGSRIQS